MRLLSLLALGWLITVPAWAEAPLALSFGELFAQPIGPRGLEPSEKLKAASGQQGGSVVDDFGLPDQPMLDEMAAKALGVLKRAPKGFVLMIEGASIDKQAHAMDTERWMLDTLEFNRAVRVAQERDDAQGDFLVTGQVPGEQAVHTATDVPLSAYGPGALAFTGVIDNTDVFFKLAQAAVKGVVAPADASGSSKPVKPKR